MSEEYWIEKLRSVVHDETPSLLSLISAAHQAILNAPHEKDESDREAMRLLEIAYLRVGGRAR